MMVAYSFKKRFAEPILAGTKIQTIRADRKRHARPGEELQLYHGMRTRQCKLVSRQICLRVEPIMILFNPDCVFLFGKHYDSDEALNNFAQNDSFSYWNELRAFWRETHGEQVFRGVLIGWGDFDLITLKRKPIALKIRACRKCGCTDDDCSGCIQRTGIACHWVEADLCSACDNRLLAPNQRETIKIGRQ